MKKKDIELLLSAFHALVRDKDAQIESLQKAMKLRSDEAESKLESERGVSNSLLELIAESRHFSELVTDVQVKFSEPKHTRQEILDVFGYIIDNRDEGDPLVQGLSDSCSNLHAALHPADSSNPNPST